MQRERCVPHGRRGSLATTPLRAGIGVLSASVARRKLDPDAAMPSRIHACEPSLATACTTSQSLASDLRRAHRALRQPRGLARNASAAASVATIGTDHPALNPAPELYYVDSVASLDFAPDTYDDITDEFAEKCRLLELHGSADEQHESLGSGWLGPRRIRRYHERVPWRSGSGEIRRNALSRLRMAPNACEPPDLIGDQADCRRQGPSIPAERVVDMGSSH